MHGIIVAFETQEKGPYRLSFKTFLCMWWRSQSLSNCLLNFTGQLSGCKESSFWNEIDPSENTGKGALLIFIQNNPVYVIKSTIIVRFWWNIHRMIVGS